MDANDRTKLKHAFLEAADLLLPVDKIDFPQGQTHDDVGPGRSATYRLMADSEWVYDYLDGEVAGGRITIDRYIQQIELEVRNTRHTYGLN